MRKDKQKVLELRKMGKSYNEIRAQIAISKSTLSAWLAPEGWSQRIKVSLQNQHQKKSTVRIRGLNLVRKEHLVRAYQEALEEAKKEYDKLKHHPLFIAGLMLYWGEGDKATNFSVRISNSDPALINIFVNFLRNICSVPEQRLRASVFIYHDLDDVSCRKYWSQNININLGQFTKSVLLPSRHKTKRLAYGVCSAGVSSTYLKKKIMLWISLISFDIVSSEYYKIAGII